MALATVSPGSTRTTSAEGPGNALSSRQSGRVTFSASEKSGSGPSHRGRKSSTLDDIATKDSNPFRMPSDNDIFMLRDKERQRRKQERQRQKGLKVHEKVSYASRVNAKAAELRRAALRDTGDTLKPEDGGVVKDDDFTLSVTRERRSEKETLNEYIDKKREMFLVQYSLGVKRDEMRKLEELASAEERKLEQAEQYLEDDAAMFDEFLQENDKNSVEAIKMLVD